MEDEVEMNKSTEAVACMPPAVEAQAVVAVPAINESTVRESSAREQMEAAGMRDPAALWGPAIAMGGAVPGEPAGAARNGLLMQTEPMEAPPGPAAEEEPR